MSLEVSVIVPCYNGEKFLAETLSSAIAQTVNPVEIIVIDDGSTDRSAEIAESFGTPVRVIRQSNQGESVARNRGVDEARGDWIAFLDADDLWLPTKLERQLEAGSESNVIAVHTNVETFGTTSGVTSIESEPAVARYARPRLAARNCFVTPSAMIVRRDCAPRFVEWAQRGEDMLYALDLVGLGEIRLVTDPLTRYRRHTGGQSASLVGIIDSHRALVRWLDERRETIDDSERRAIDHARLQILIDNAWSMKARRRWGEYWSFRNYLNDYRSLASEPVPDQLSQLLTNKIYPAFIYAIRDMLFGMPVDENKLERA